MRPDRKRLWSTIALVVFCLASVAKYAFNQLDLALYDAYNGPQSRSIGGARQQAILAAEFEIEPMKLVGADKTYEFLEAWLEAAYEPRTFLVWFPYHKRIRWDYLCVRPKTDSFHETFSFSLTPEYEKDFAIGGLGRNGVQFTQSGKDLYFQKVPADLRRLKIGVSIETYGQGKNITVGTVRLTRRESSGG